MTASKYEEESDRAPSTVTIITQQDIQSAGATTVNEAIMRLGGVLGRPSLYGGNEHALDLGGFGDTAASNTVFVIDGVPYKQGDASEIRLSSIPIDQVQRIEIQRGSAGVLYGEGAVSGVIHIITNASTLYTTPRQEAVLAVGGGSFGMRESKLHAMKVWEGWHLSFTGLDRTADGFREHSNSIDRNNQVALQYKGEGVRAGLMLGQSKEYAQTPGGLTLAQYTARRQQAQPDSLTYKTWMNTESHVYGFFSEVNLSTLLLRLDAKQRTRDYDALAVQYGAPASMQFKTVNDFYALTATHVHGASWGDNTVVAGAENNRWRQDRVYPGNPGFGDQIHLHANATAAYIKDDVYIKAWDTRFSAGFRREDIEKDQVTVGGFTPGTVSNNHQLDAWELGVSKRLSPDVNLYARGARAYRVANIDEFAANLTPVLPQTSVDKELGGKFRLSGHARWGVRWFRNDLTHEIIFDPLAGGNMNLDPTRRQGVDVDVHVQPSSTWTLGAVASVRKASFRSGVYAGQVVPMSPQQMAMLRSDWRLTESHAWGVIWNRVSSQYIAGDFSNTQSMPAYSTLDTQYTYRFKDVEATLIVKNVLNKLYYSYATNAYAVWGDPTSRFTSLYPDPGRSVYGHLKIRF